VGTRVGRVRSAAADGLLSCPTCALVSRAPATGSAACPRCGTRLHFRKPGSIGRTWAFLVAAMAVYVPANVLPMMSTSSLFSSQTDTIMSGIVFLWKDGSWHLALIVFVASILVPLAKMLSLLVLLLSVQLGWYWRAMERARLYRVIDAIGRWSMLDIFVVTLLSTVVQLTALASVRPGPGALAFGAVVVLTMLASASFDPRLIWDSVRENNERTVPA
jgi:paraquat-inducible protein A